MKTIRNKDQVWRTAVEFAERLNKDHGKMYAVSITAKVFELTPRERHMLNDAINASYLLEACNG